MRHITNSGEYRKVSRERGQIAHCRPRRKVTSLFSETQDPGWDGSTHVDFFHYPLDTNLADKPFVSKGTGGLGRLVIYPAKCFDSPAHQ